MICATAIGTVAVGRAGKLNPRGTVVTFAIVARSRTPEGAPRKILVHCRLSRRRAADLAPLLTVGRRVVAVGAVVPVVGDRVAELEMDVDRLDIEGRRPASSAEGSDEADASPEHAPEPES
jgi:hypothetical protein